MDYLRLANACITCLCLHLILDFSLKLYPVKSWDWWALWYFWCYPSAKSNERVHICQLNSLSKHKRKELIRMNKNIRNAKSSTVSKITYSFCSKFIVNLKGSSQFDIVWNTYKIVQYNTAVLRKITKSNLQFKE